MPWKCEVPRSSHSDKDGFATTKLDHAEMEDTVPPDRMDGSEVEEADLRRESHQPIQEQNYSSNQLKQIRPISLKEIFHWSMTCAAKMLSFLWCLHWSNSHLQNSWVKLLVQNPNFHPFVAAAKVQHHVWQVKHPNLWDVQRSCRRRSWLLPIVQQWSTM